MSITAGPRQTTKPKTRVSSSVFVGSLGSGDGRTRSHDGEKIDKGIMNESYAHAMNMMLTTTRGEEHLCY